MKKDTFQHQYTLKRPDPKRKRYNSAIPGLALGIIFPLLGIALLYFVRYDDYSFAYYLKMFSPVDSSPMRLSNASKVVSLSLIGQLIPFYYFLNRKAYLTTKGIIMASILWGLLVIFYLFIWQ